MPQVLANQQALDARYAPVPALVEINLGALPRTGGEFDITGLSGLTSGTYVDIEQACGPYTGKGTLQDEALDTVNITAYVVDASTIRAYWQASSGFIAGNVKFIYTLTQLT